MDSKVQPCKPALGYESIDILLNEILFKLWMNGKSLNGICEMFSESPRAFSIRTLLRAKARFGWEDRKAKIVADLGVELDNEIKYSRRKQLQLIHMAVDMNLKVIESEYAEFMRDPKAYIESYRIAHRRLPPWLALDSSSMLELFKTHHFATGESIVDNNSDNHKNGPLILTPDEEALIWKTIRTAATRKALPTSIEVTVNSTEDDDPRE